MPAKRVVAIVLAGALAAVGGTVAVVAPWEGERLVPYRDIVGVWTVCYGETSVPMRKYTRVECKEMLSDSVSQHLTGVARCISRPLEDHEWVAIGSWAFNVGVSAACNSSLVRQINAGQPAQEWCQQLLRWDRAGGKKVRGLTLRRQSEYRICIGEDR